MKKKIVWILLAMATVGAIAAAVIVGINPTITVDTAVVRRGHLRIVVSEEGQTRVRQHYLVSAPVAGRLTRIGLDEGDAVSQGAVLAHLYPLPEGARSVEMAQAQIAAAEARQAAATAQVAELRERFEQQQREVERGRTLAKNKLITKENLEQRELALASARQRLSAAQATLTASKQELRAARAALLGAMPQQVEGQAVEVRSPVDGVVFRVLEKSEHVVMAGTPLLELGDTNNLEVVVDVLSEDAARIEPGAEVTFKQWGGEALLSGGVRLVEPQAFTKVSALGVEEQRVNVIVALDEIPPTLGAGYRLEASITTWAGEDVLSVPTSALFRSEGKWQVFLVRKEKALRRPLSIGHRSETDAEVLEGLAEGDTVILFPSDQIEEGVGVQPRRS